MCILADEQLGDCWKRRSASEQCYATTTCTGSLACPSPASFTPVTVISNVARVSRPGCWVYVWRTEIPRVLGGMGINILTTLRGVMTGRQARKEGLGGEVLCEIW